jgi:hypothetical protein
MEYPSLGKASHATERPRGISRALLLPLLDAFAKANRRKTFCKKLKMRVSGQLMLKFPGNHGMVSRHNNMPFPKKGRVPGKGI